MITLDRYLGTTLAKAFLLVMVAFASLFSVLDLAEELEDTGEGAYQLQDALLFVALTLPHRILDLLPAIALLSSILTLGTLANGSELIAMQAAGISAWRIGGSVLRIGGLIILTALMIGEWMVPPLDKLALTQRSEAISGSITLRTQHSFWSRDGHRFVNVRTLLEGHVPAAIDLYQFDDQGRLRRFLHARRANIQEDGHWVLLDVTAKSFDTQEVATHHLERLPSKPLLSTVQREALILPPESLALPRLYEYVQGQRARGEESKRYALALWHRLTLPLSSAAMFLIALPLALGPGRLESTGLRLVVGTILGFTFYLLKQVTGYSGLLLDLDPSLAALTPVALLLALTLGLWWRLR